jgi:hypothetical protein
VHSPQLRVLGFGFLQDGDVGVGVGVFPEGEEDSPNSGLSLKQLFCSALQIPRAVRHCQFPCAEFVDV